MIRRLIIFSLVALMSLIPVPVRAFDEQFYSSNDILYYDDRATACLPQTGTASSGTGTSSADESKNAETILRYLTGKGLTLAQATGFVGNMRQESTLNPAKIQGGSIAPSTYQPVDGVGFGLVQWTPSSRQKPLQDLATKTSRSVIDMNLQLDYVWQEVTGTYKATLLALTDRPSITPTDAAIIVHGNTTGDARLSIAPKVAYEASGDSTEEIIKTRGGNAEYFYNMFKGKIPDGTGVGGYTDVAGAQQVSVAGDACGGGTYMPTGDCPVTAPKYGEGGNSHQLSSVELTQTYGPGGTSAQSNLVTLDFLGKPVQVHKLTAACLQAVINDIKKANINYTVKVIGGWRTAAGAGLDDASKSYHYYGAAIDINPDQNGFYSGGASHPYDIPQQYVDIFHAHGWSWGGNWHSVKDYMHFEFNGIGPADKK